MQVNTESVPSLTPAALESFAYTTLALLLARAELRSAAFLVREMNPTHPSINHENVSAAWAVVVADCAARSALQAGVTVYDHLGAAALVLSRGGTEKAVLHLQAAAGVSGSIEDFVAHFGRS